VGIFAVTTSNWKKATLCVSIGGACLRGGVIAACRCCMRRSSPWRFCHFVEHQPEAALYAQASLRAQKEA